MPARHPQDSPASVAPPADWAQLVMEAMTEGVFDWDFATDRLAWSDSTFRTTGLAPDLVPTFAAWMEQLHGEDAARYLSAVAQCIPDGSAPFACDFRYRAAGGRWRWARQVGTVRRDAAGRALRLTGSLRDITELKVHERELADQRAILQSTLENIDQGITMVDAQLHTIALNRRFLELLEFPPERFASGFHMEEAFRFNAERGEYGPGDIDEQVHQRLELAARFEPHAFERRRPDGTIIAVRGRPLPGGGFVSTYSDVTEQRRTEEGLRRSEERYALATSAAAEGIYEWTVDTGALFLTDRAKAFFSLTDRELTSADWNARVHPDDMGAYRRAIVEHFKGRATSLELEYRVRNPAGGWLWVLDRGLGVRDAAGHVVKVVGALTDVTQRKTVEMELRRARDLAEEALEQQTATAAILQVISSSPTDTQPVFDAIVRGGLKLFSDAAISIALPDGEMVRAAAVAEHDAGRAQSWCSRFPFPLSSDYMHGSAILQRRIVDVPDVREAPAEWAVGARNFLASGYRAITIMPLMRGDAAIGALSVVRVAPGPLTPKQLTVLRTFADQAVIAIENVRLFNETRESLERQTATAEILRVIAGSPSEVQPVLDAIVGSAARLFARRAVIRLAEPEGLRRKAISHGSEPGLFNAELVPIDRDSLLGVVCLDGQAIQIEDTHAPSARPYTRTVEGRPRWRAIASAPLMREGTVLGVLSVSSERPGLMTDKQMALLSTFADQAVIAIQNARLFNETREALEQQQASAAVLGAISSSIADTAPVFDKILESCQRLFAGTIVGLNLLGEDGMLRMGAYQGARREEFERTFPYPNTTESGSGLCIREARVVHFPDAQDGPGVPPRTRKGCRTLGIKSVIFAPVLWKERGLGAIFVGRDRVSSFGDKEIALLRTFADQAAIAIENVRLFDEIQQKGRQLEVANRHKSEFLANMSHELRTPLNAIIGFTRIVMRRSEKQLEPRQYENLEKILASGQNLLALINAILDLAKVEAGRVEVLPGEVDPARLLEQCVRTVEPLVDAGRVALVRTLEEPLPSMYADEGKMRQIVVNLLSNAVKFTEKGSIQVRARATGDRVDIAVADTGIGIAADQLERVFDEFEQADASSTREHGGTGLGLTIARRLARLMGGDIRAESQPGAGSTFTLSLPMRYVEPRS